MMTLAFASMFAMAAATQPASLFSDHVVLQRDLAVPVFGTGQPGTPVDVQLGNDRASTVVGADGTWLVKLPRKKAGGWYELKVNGQVFAKDVTFGEVWVASGQSNMEWNVGSCRPDQVKAAVEKADNDLRMFTVPKVSVEEPATTVGGQWQSATPGTVGGFSAVGYWYARTLREKLKVPVGVIHTSWGGTPAESWTSRDALNKAPNLKYMLDNYLAQLKSTEAQRAEYNQKLAAFTASRADVSNAGAEAGWQKPEWNDAPWRMVALPTSLEAIEGRDVDGAFWFRRTVDVPAELVGQAWTLELGAIDDADVAYINGVEVGRIDLSVPNHWMLARQYKLANGTLRAGRNSLAVRVFDSGQGGGFISGAGVLRLVSANGKSISLDGAWKYQPERIAKPEGSMPSAPMGPGDPWAPGGLYNGMIAPLIPFGIRGAIWYQGESNSGRAYQYRELFPTMIKNWRSKWGQGDFPFYFVQLANYMKRNTEPVESAWAELREAQTMTLKLPKTGMATIIDIGEANDIHPRNKQDVGYRLAQNALAQTYRLDVVPTGPTFRGFRVQGNVTRISFDRAKGLKSVDGQAVIGFSVAGADKKFVWADARIEGETIVLTNPSGVKPVAVRYGWSDNPATNLVNAAGLPTVPFRTDQWPGLTVTNR